MNKLGCETLLPYILAILSFLPRLPVPRCKEILCRITRRPERGTLTVALAIPAPTAQNGDAQNEEDVSREAEHHGPSGAGPRGRQLLCGRTNPKIRNSGKQVRCGLRKGRGALVSASTMGTSTGARRGGWRCGRTFSTAERPDHAAPKRRSQTTRQARFLRRLGNFALGGGGGSSDGKD